MTEPTELKDDDLITVCAACLRACCWQGEFMCDDAQNAATTKKTVKWLREHPQGEHEHYWKRERQWA